MVSPTQLCWRYHSLSQRQQYIYIYIYMLNVYIYMLNVYIYMLNVYIYVKCIYIYVKCIYIYVKCIYIYVKLTYIYIYVNFDGLAQGNAYKPTGKPINIYGYGTRASATIMITLVSQQIIRSLPMWWKCFKWDHRLKSFDFCGFIQIKYYSKIPVP